jgi:phosphoglycolate phosphatase-like HAD superfamily hydrolase
MVGDSHHDLTAAVAAGFKFVWASYGYCDDAGPMDPSRFRRIDAFPELIGALAELTRAGSV